VIRGSYGVCLEVVKGWLVVLIVCLEVVIEC